MLLIVYYLNQFVYSKDNIILFALQKIVLYKFYEFYYFIDM